MGYDKCDIVELDHIIPKSLFDTTPREDLVEYCNNIINLALLPKKQNISKSDKKLNQINLTLSHFSAYCKPVISVDF